MSISETSVDGRGSRFLRMSGDFANIFKAFIGSNYLSMPFGFSKAGVWLGTAGLLVIAFTADHCCHLIVRCKKIVVQQKVLHGSQRSEEEIESSLQYGDIGRSAFGRVGYTIVNFFLALTQFGFCVGYLIFLGGTLKGFLPDVDTLALITFPVPFLVLCSWLRSVRVLAPLSAVANVAVLFGFVAVLYFEFLDMRPDPTCVEAAWETFPIFLGTTTAAFEGIGTIIPIESSMKGDRKTFSPLLHGAILFVSALLGSFGIIGYEKYGADVKQIISQEFDSESTVSFMMQTGLLVAIFFTYPLQLFPIIQIGEQLLFFRADADSPPSARADASLRREQGVAEGVSPSDSINANEEDDTDEENPLLDKLRAPTEVADGVVRASRVRTEPIALTVKRNIFRTCLVFATAGIAMIFRDNFGNFVSFVGAVGGSALAFCLPCMCLVKLCPDMPLRWKIKNYALVVFGITSATSGVIANIIFLE